MDKERQQRRLWKYTGEREAQLEERTAASSPEDCVLRSESTESGHRQKGQEGWGHRGHGCSLLFMLNVVGGDNGINL